MGGLLERLDNAIEERCRIKNGERILVAVSGGVDSMVLLHALHRLALRHGWKLIAAHLNHRLRGQSSDADERLVSRTAQRLGVQLVADKADVRQLARAEKISLEMAARKARHQFLALAAQKCSANTIVLAHHLNDVVELFLLRLLRGSGGEGLSGLRWLNASPANRHLLLARPLLGETKEALAQFAAAEKIQFREDATNQSLEFLRNRIRHKLLPVLQKQFQPALINTVSRAAEIVGAESDLVQQLASSWLAQARNSAKRGNKIHAEPTYEALHVAVQRRCVLIQLLEMGLAGDFDLVEALRIRPGMPVSISAPGIGSELEPLRIVRQPDGLLKRVSPARDLKFNCASCAVSLEQERSRGVCEFEGLRITWHIRKHRRSTSHRKLPQQESFDAQKVGSDILLRHWQPGDRFQPIGMSRSVKLQDFFINNKIPSTQRRTLVLAATAKGEIFWVEGTRISDRFKLTAQTRCCLVWRWERL